MSGIERMAALAVEAEPMRPEEALYWREFDLAWRPALGGLIVAAALCAAAMTLSASRPTPLVLTPAVAPAAAR